MKGCGGMKGVSLGAADALPRSIGASITGPAPSWFRYFGR